MLSVFTQALIWLSLYYFTFEMTYIRLALESLSPKIFEIQAYRVSVVKVVVLSLMLSMGMIQVFIIYLQCYQGETVQAYPGLFLGIIYALRAVKVLTDGYMYQMFVRQLVFFLRKKRQLRQEELDTDEVSMSCRVKFVVTLTGLIYLLCVGQTLLAVL
jgi:hypothetical protein